LSSNLFDTLITNGLVVTAQGITRADIGIRGEKIAAIMTEDERRKTEHEPSVHRPPSSVRVIDATGKYILPGVIDAHVHPIYLDDKYDTSVTAAHGGVTTLIHYCYVKPGEKILPTVERFRDDGLAKSVLDFGMHAGLFDVANQIEEVPAAFKLGVTSFKVFMTYAKLKWMTDDYWMTALMDVVAREQGLVCVHTENGLATDYLEDKYLRVGKPPKEMFAAMRPDILEAEALNRAISIAQVMGAATYIVHNSAAANLEPLRRAREKGWRVWGETCPQYLTLTEETTLRLGPLAKIGPPLRTARDNAAMWEGLADGTLVTIGSDHAPKGKKLDDDFFDAAYGSPQIETMLPVVYDAGVNGGKLTLPQMVAALSEMPARLFGLYPQKGTLAVGSDADLIIFDPARMHTISAATQHSKAGYTLYEGRTVTGAPVLTMQRGEVIVENGELRARRGRACFLKTNTAPLYPKT
jgi:dihydropyrimidinase